MAQEEKKYLGKDGLQSLIENIKSGFATLIHKHKLEDIEDYKVDTELSSTSANPVQNKTISEEFGAITKSIDELETNINNKADSSHNHDDMYYTETEIDTKLESKSDTSHNHDAAYDAKGSASAVQTNLNTVSNTLDSHIDDSKVHVTETEKATWNNKSNFSGNYNDLTNKPTISASAIGLGNVDNTSDANKPVSTAQQAAIDTTLTSAKSYTDTKTNGMATTAVVDNKINTHNASTTSHNDIRTALAAVKEDVDAFFKDATISTEAKDTLKEIQEYITSDVEAAAAMTASINNKSDKGHGHAISEITDLQTTLDNKAEKSHGTHVTWSTISPNMAGTPSVGSETKVARGDHVHPVDTSRAAKSEFDTHVANTVSHITTTERNTWNAKASTASATTATAGLMSAADKTKLNGIAEGANKYVHPTTSGNKHIPSGGASGQFLKWSENGTAVWAADNDTKYTAGTGLALNGTTFSNSGVRSVVTGTTNGTIIVNTNGTTAAVPVKGLGNAAYTSIDTALSNNSTNAVQNKVVNSAISTLTTSVTTNANSITTLSNAIAAIEEITLDEISALFA